MLKTSKRVPLYIHFINIHLLSFQLSGSITNKLTRRCIYIYIHVYICTYTPLGHGLYIYMYILCTILFYTVENTRFQDNTRSLETQLSDCSTRLKKLQEKHATLTEYFEQKEHNLHRLGRACTLCIHVYTYPIYLASI